MLSEDNLAAIDAAGLRFIVGSRQTKAPKDLAKQFHYHPDTDLAEGTTVDTVTTRARFQPAKDQLATADEPVWDPDNEQHRTRYWRAVWQYRVKRATRDLATLEKQREKALRVVEGQQAVKSARFVRTQGATRVFDQTTFDRATTIVGWKGYVTNLLAHTMGAAEIVASYHQLWHVGQSFRMSKTDLQARPMLDLSDCTKCWVQSLRLMANTTARLRSSALCVTSLLFTRRSFFCCSHRSTLFPELVVCPFDGECFTIMSTLRVRLVTKKKCK